MLQLMVLSAICGDKGRDGLVRARANPPLSDSQHSVPLFCAIHVAAAVVLATMIGMKVPARDKCIAKLGNKKNEVIGPPAVSEAAKCRQEEAGGRMMTPVLSSPDAAASAEMEVTPS